MLRLLVAGTDARGDPVHFDVIKAFPSRLPCRAAARALNITKGFVAREIDLHGQGFEEVLVYLGSQNCCTQN